MSGQRDRTAVLAFAVHSMTDQFLDDVQDQGDTDSPLARLRTELERAEDEYRHRWGPDEEHQLYRDIAEAFRPSVPSLEIGSDLVERIRALHDEVGTPQHGLADLPAFVQMLASHPIVREGLAIRHAYEALGLLRGAESRLGDLLALILERRVSPRADQYLRRANRLYLWGFEEETIVMCGATLEAAYQARFPDLEMFQLQIVKKDNATRFDVRQYVHAARASGVFSLEQSRLADAIREARNSSVHANEPSSGSTRRDQALLTAKKAIVGTAELLQCLFPLGD